MRLWRNWRNPDQHEPRYPGCRGKLSGEQPGGYQRGRLGHSSGRFHWHLLGHEQWIQRRYGPFLRTRTGLERRLRIHPILPVEFHQYFLHPRWFHRKTGMGEDYFGSHGPAGYRTLIHWWRSQQLREAEFEFLGLCFRISKAILANRNRLRAGKRTLLSGRFLFCKPELPRLYLLHAAGSTGSDRHDQQLRERNCDVRRSIRIDYRWNLRVHSRFRRHGGFAEPEGWRSQWQRQSSALQTRSGGSVGFS